MRSNLIKWLCGIFAFLLPVAVAMMGKRLDHSAYRHDATYKALIPAVVCGALLLATLVPAILLMTSRMRLPYRMGFTVAVWALLVLQLYWVFFVVVVNP